MRERERERERRRERERERERWREREMYFGCSSLSWMRGRSGGIISEPISLQIMINAVDTSNMFELFKSYHKIT